MAAQAGGTVAEFLVDVGQDVFEGAVLARISNQGLEAADENARAALELAQSRVEKAGAAIIAARLEATRARADAVRARGEFDRAQRTYQRQKMLHRRGRHAAPDLRKIGAGLPAGAGRIGKPGGSGAGGGKSRGRADQGTGGRQEASWRTNRTTRRRRRRTWPPPRCVLPWMAWWSSARAKWARNSTQQEQAEFFRIAVNLAELQVRRESGSDALKRLKPGDRRW